MALLKGEDQKFYQYISEIMMASEIKHSKNSYDFWNPDLGKSVAISYTQLDIWVCVQRRALELKVNLGLSFTDVIQSHMTK